MTLEDTKRILVGEWVSFTPEVRPSATRNPDGTLKPFYLSREFKYLGDDRFELTISNWADPYGQVSGRSRRPAWTYRVGRRAPDRQRRTKGELHRGRGVRGHADDRGLCGSPQQVGVGWVRALAGRATSERFREDVCAFRLGRGAQLHGVRPDLCSGGLSVLGGKKR